MRFNSEDFLLSCWKVTNEMGVEIDIDIDIDTDIDIDIDIFNLAALLPWLHIFL